MNTFDLNFGGIGAINSIATVLGFYAEDKIGQLSYTSDFGVKTSISYAGLVPANTLKTEVQSKLNNVYSNFLVNVNFDESYAATFTISNISAFDLFATSAESPIAPASIVDVSFDFRFFAM